MPGPNASDSEQTTTSLPWEVQQPFLESIFNRAESLYGSGDLGAIGEESGLTGMSQALTAAGALSGGPGVVNNAIGLGNATLGGAFLDNQNPYLQGAIEYAQQPAIDAFNEQVAPGIDATFANAGAGGLGSGAYANVRNRAEDTLTRNLAGAATQAGYQNYGDERARQQQLIGAAPGLEQAGFANFDRLGQVGAQLDARSQAEAGQPYTALSQFSNLINSVPAYGTSTTTGSTTPSSNPFMTGIGGALALSSLFI